MKLKRILCPDILPRLERAVALWTNQLCDNLILHVFRHIGVLKQVAERCRTTKNPDGIAILRGLFVWTTHNPALDFGGEAFDWPLTAVYTVSFLIFWVLISTATAITMLLAVEDPRV